MRSNVNTIEEFIKSENINAEILRFKGKVISVDMASKVSGFPKDKIIKTLIVIADGKPYAILLSGDKMLDYGKLRKLLKCKKVRLARREEVMKVTGFDVGEVSPLSPSLEHIPKVADSNILSKDIVLIGGGSHYALIKIRTEELIRAISPVIADVSK